MIFRFASMVLLATALASCPAWSESGDLYKPVDPADLASNPQKYWAIGIVFKDTLIAAPARETISVGKKNYAKFSTQIAGDCYASAEALASAPPLTPDQDYIFTGTVLQRSSGSGWFSSGGAKYIIAVQGIIPALKGVSSLTDILKMASANADSADYQTMQRMNEMFVGMQSDIAATAQNRNLEMWEMFLSGSSNRLETQSIVSSGLSTMVTQTKLNPEDLFAQFVISLLALKYAPPEGAVTNPEPADELAAPTEEPKEEIKKEAKPKEKKKPKAAAPIKVKEEAPPALKPRLRATPMEVEVPAAPVVEEIAVEIPVAPAPAAEPVVDEPVVAPAPVIEVPAPAPEPLSTNAPTLPEATPEHMEQTMDQLDPAQPMPTPAADAPKAPITPAENSNFPVPL